MKNIFIIVISLIAGATILHLFNSKSNENQYESGAMLISELKDVGKLVVNEAKISKIHKFNNQSHLVNLGIAKFWDTSKEVLTEVGADVSIQYDLREIQYEIDETNKILHIIHIPEAETKIGITHIKHYTTKESKLNELTSEDYNVIYKKIAEDITEEIKNSKIPENSKSRLISELGKFLIVTKHLGWRLEYRDKPIYNEREFESILDIPQIKAEITNMNR